jgi:hypothetical protein
MEGLGDCPSLLLALDFFCSPLTAVLLDFALMLQKLCDRPPGALKTLFNDRGVMYGSNWTAEAVALRTAFVVVDEADLLWQGGYVKDLTRLLDVSAGGGVAEWDLSGEGRAMSTGFQQWLCQPSALLQHVRICAPS